MGTNPQGVNELSRRTYIAAGVAGSIGALSGCLGGDDDDREFEATVTHWPDLMYNAPYHVAIQNGYFEDNDINVEFVGSEGGGTTVRNVVDGGLPFGEVATPAAINAYMAGAPITAIAGATRTVNEIYWVAPDGSDIESIQDLEGGSMGYTSAGSVTETTSALVSAISDELDPDVIDFQEMGGVGEGLTGVEEGVIDAAANIDPIFANQQADDEPWQVVFWAGDYVDHYQQTSIIVEPDLLEDEPEIVESYLDARAEGIEFLLDNPEETAEMFAEGTEGFSTDALLESIEAIEPENHYSTGAFDVEGLRNVETAMYETGLLNDDEDVPWDDIFTQEFIDEDEHIDFDEV